jgi:hypothetical protein
VTTLAGERIDQRAMEGHHRFCGDARLDVVGGAPVSSASSAASASVHFATQLTLPDHERRTSGRESGQFGHPAPAVARRGAVGAVEDEADEGARYRLALEPLAYRGQELLLERVHALVDEIPLRRKVVEDGRLGDVGGTGDLGDA